MALPWPAAQPQRCSPAADTHTSPPLAAVDATRTAGLAAVCLARVGLLRLRRVPALTAAPHQIELTSAAGWASSRPAAPASDESANAGAQTEPGAANCPRGGNAMPSWPRKPRAPLGTHVSQLVRQFSGEGDVAAAGEAAAAGLQRRSAAAAAVPVWAPPRATLAERRVRELARLFEAPATTTTMVVAERQAEAAAAPPCGPLALPPSKPSAPTTQRRLPARAARVGGRRPLSLAERFQVMLCVLLLLLFCILFLILPIPCFVVAGVAGPVLLARLEAIGHL